MCIQTRIQKAIAEKAALDARIAKLEKLEAATAPVKKMLGELLADYSQEVPEELPGIWEEILAIGQKFNLSVQPLAADELQQWEAVNAKNEVLKQQLKEARSERRELKGECGFLKYERDDLKKEVSELRSQIEQLKNDSDKWRAAATISNLAVKSLTEKQENSETPTTWEIEDIAPGLEKLYQEALTENTEPETQSIPALTLWQPWATLIEQEVKRIETRSWSTSHRGPIAIHAAKKPIYTGSPELLDLLQGEKEPPLGVVVAIANLLDCVEMTPEFIAQQSETELKCGDWQPGRFAWVLEIIRPVVPPIPATGGQKLWSWSGTSVAAELEYLEKLKTAPEPEETTGTVDGILESKGFFRPDNFLGTYSSDDRHETYRGWDIYYSLPNGGVVSIGLDNYECKQAWDASTEYIQEIDATFPESLADYDEIVDWTRALIDRIENLEVPGATVEEELALDDDGKDIPALTLWQPWATLVAKEVKRIETRSWATNYRGPIAIHAAKKPVGISDYPQLFELLPDNCEFPLGAVVAICNVVDCVEMTPEFIAQQSEQELKCGDWQPGRFAWVLEIIRPIVPPIPASGGQKLWNWTGTSIEAELEYLEKISTSKTEKSADTVEEDKFVELVKISNCVGYLKRRDSGEILSAYAAFAMKNEEGEKLDTFAKPRATKWAEYFRANNEASEEGKIFQLVVSDPRKSKRLVSDNPKMPFSYEIKLTGVDRSYLDRLAQIDLSVPPGEQKVKKPSTVKLPVEVAPTYQVIANGYQLASGTEQEMRSRFEQELQTFGSQGRSAMSLACNGENIEAYYYDEFAFIRAQDFDEENPEYFTVHTPTKTNFRVYRSLTSGSSWINSIYPYHPNLFSTKEAAAVDAVRRSLKAESAG